jgi:VIT1/CCC1 family predicted Fe2+/Mn2+ transporter
MHMLTDMLQQGGLPMMLVLAAGLAHFVAALVAIILAMMRKLDLSPVLWAGVLVIVLLGMTGAILGQIQGYSAIGYASPEMKQTLLASGISTSLYTAEMSLIAAIVALGFTGIASTLARNLVPRKRGRVHDEDAEMDPDLYMPE